MVFVCGLFVSRGGPFGGLEDLHADRAAVCFGPWWRLRARLGACKAGLGPPVFFILTVPRRYFCCGSLLFLLSVFILWFIYYVSDIFCKF